MQETQFDSWVRKIHWRRDRLPIPVFLGFPCGSAGKESACSAADLGLIPRLGRYPGEGNGYPLQCSGLENSIDCIVHGVTKESDTTEQLSLSLFSISHILKWAYLLPSWQQYPLECKLFPLRDLCLSHLLLFLPIPSRCWGEGDGTPLQYSCLENPMDRGAW